MNWTGGRLSRHHRKPKGSLTVQQKQYFAKVQNTSRNWSQGVSPHNILVLDSINQFNNLNDIDGQKNPQLIQGHRVASPSFPIIELCGAGLVVPDRRDVPQKSEDLQKESHQLPPSERHTIGHSADDDLYNATPLPWQKKSKVPISAKSWNEDDSLAGDNNLFYKRQKLLHKRDWVGMSLAGPSPLHFVPPEQDDNVGKRRRLTGSNRIEHRRGARKPNSPSFARQYTTGSKVSNLDQRNSGDATGRTVRIYIGGTAVQSSNSCDSQHKSSSTVRNEVHHLKPSQSSYTISSDTMLLDSELSAHIQNLRSSGQADRARSCFESELYSPTTREKSIYPSSPPSICHPIPLSARKSRLIHSPPSTRCGSNVPQMSQSQSWPPSSQLLEDKKWKSWADPQETHGEEVAEKIMRGPVDHEFEICREGTTNDLQFNGQCPIDICHSPSKVDWVNQKGWKLHRRDISIFDRDDEHLTTVRNGNPGLKQTNSIGVRGIGSQDDLDQIWMNFVFDISDKRVDDISDILRYDRITQPKLKPAVEINAASRSLSEKYGAHETQSGMQGEVIKKIHCINESPQRFISSCSGSLSVHATT